MTTRSAAREIQSISILALNREIAQLVRTDALLDLPDSIVNEIRDDLSSIRGNLKVAKLAADRPEPRWPVSRAVAQPRQGWEHEAETSLLSDSEV